MLPAVGLTLVFSADALILWGCSASGLLSGFNLVWFGLITHILVSAIAIRFFNRLFPIPTGEFKIGSPEFNRWQAQAVIALFSSVFFDVFLPMPLKAPWFRLFGAKLGSGAVISGRLVDSTMVTIGDNSTVGLDGIILGHWVGRETAYLGPVVIGSDVIVGARSVIHPGVSVGDEATVGIGAIVTTNKDIPAGETWLGVPARPAGSGGDSGPASG